MFKIIFSFFLLGLSFGAGPCVASCGPLLLSYVAGTRKNIFRSIGVYIVFSFSRITVYLLLGLLVFFLGKLSLDRMLGVFSVYVFILGGSFIILVGILTIFNRTLRLMPGRFLQKNIIERDKKSIVMFGLVIGLLPCAPLLAVISYVGLISKHPLQALLYSLFFGIGTFISPLILLVIAAGFIPHFLPDKKQFIGRIFNFICGLLIIVLGLQLIMKVF